MITTLNEVDAKLTKYLKSIKATVRLLKVGQTLDPLNFIKADHSVIVGKVQTLTLWTMSGPCCGPDRTDGTPADTAAALWTQLQDLLSVFIEHPITVHISNPYIDYEKGRLYYERQNWKTSVDVAIYSYDGEYFRTVRATTDVFNSPLDSQLDIMGHALIPVAAFEVKVWPENVKRDLWNSTHATKEKFFANLRKQLVESTEKAHQVLNDLEGQS